MTNHPLNQTFDLTRRGRRSFLTLFPLLRFTLTFHLLFGFKIISAGSPKACEEVVEGTKTRKITGFKTAEDSVIGDAFLFVNPFGKANFWFGHEKEEI